MSINLEWYRVFYWTARTGSLSRAADRLHITQPAVSHTLKQLEAEVGARLFTRTARGVSPTAEGETLFKHVDQALRAFELGEQTLADMRELTTGEVNIGAGDTLCKHYLLPCLERFRARYPGIKLRVTNRTTPETIGLLKDGLIDFGLVTLPAADERLTFRPSAPLQDCLVSGKTYAALTDLPVPVALKELRNHPLLMLEAGGSTRRYLDAYAIAHGEVLTPELELGSLDLLVAFARRGFGLTFAVRSFIADELASGELIELPLDPPVPQRHIGICTLKGRPLSAAAAALMEMLPDDSEEGLPI